MLNGKAPGETSLIIWQVNGERQFFNVKIRTSVAVANDKLESVRRELKKKQSSPDEYYESVPKMVRSFCVVQSEI